MLSFSAPPWPPSVVGVSHEHVVVVVAVVVLYAFYVVESLPFDNLDAVLDADEHIPANLALAKCVINKIAYIHTQLQIYSSVNNYVVSCVL